MTVMKIKMTDRAGVLRVYTTEDISPRISSTPEGYLLCEAVPIARTGTQLYAKDETPIETDSGIVTIHRTEEEVFSPETLASFEGKSVTLDHPDEFVSPDNWRALTVGLAQNVRRGEYEEADLLLADLLITDREAITAIQKNNLRQVSCGYDTHYIQDSIGVGRQTNIIGNHVALVSRGRAGVRCSIRDKETIKMVKKRSAIDRLLAYFHAKDEESFQEAVEEVKDELEEAKKEDKATDAMSKILDSLKAIDERLEKLEAKDEDEDVPAEDSPTDVVAAGKIEEAGVVVHDSELRSRVEILSPSLKFKSKDTAMVESINAALGIQETAEAVKVFLRGRAVDSLSASQVADVFLASSDLVAQLNKAKGTRHSAVDMGSMRPAHLTVDEINKRNREFWSKK